MNEKLYKICRKIFADEIEAHKFMEIQTIDEMYEYFHSKVPELSEEEFEDFIVDALENGSIIDNCTDDDLENVAGGINLGAKVVSAGLSLMSILPGVSAANKQNVDASSSVNTSVSKFEDKEKEKHFIKRKVAECVNNVDSSGISALIKAVEKEKVNKKYISALLDNDAVSDKHRGMLLCLATQYGHREIVELLIKKGVNMEKYGNAALSIAAMTGDCAIGELLVKNGAEINKCVDINTIPECADASYLAAVDTPLITAIRRHNEDFFKMLWKKGVDVNIKNRRGETVLMSVAGWSWGHYIEIMKLLLEKGADVNTKDKYGRTALMYAADATIPNIEIFKLLLAKGADINTKDKYGRTALAIATRQKEFAYKDELKMDWDIVITLLKDMADKYTLKANNE